MDRQTVSDAQERARVESLIRLLPGSDNAIDVGARNGDISLRLVERFAQITALDLIKPRVIHPKVRPIQGNAASMEFDDEAFESVLCAEVLEHLEPETLVNVCHELSRITRTNLLVGVPYRQDTRVGRTTCLTCGQRNPPWGHVNTFDEQSLVQLFPDLKCVTVEHVGTGDGRTNWLSALLMDFAGNPYGTYDQDEACRSLRQPIDLPTAAQAAPKDLQRRCAQVADRASTSRAAMPELDARAFQEATN